MSLLLQVSSRLSTTVAALASALELFEATAYKKEHGYQMYNNFISMYV
jgi:hypothetical protein